MSRSRQGKGNGNENQNGKTWQDKVIELLNKMAEKLEKLDKLDEIKEAINSLPERMAEKLYGKETVN